MVTCALFILIPGSKAQCLFPYKLLFMYTCTHTHALNRNHCHLKAKKRSLKRSTGNIFPMIVFTSGYNIHNSFLFRHCIFFLISRLL